MVILLSIVVSTGVCYYMLSEQNRMIDVILENQRRIISASHEFSCLLAVPIQDRKRALAEDWCIGYMDRRLKKYDPNRFGPPNGGAVGG